MQHGSLKTPNSMAADNCPKQPNHQETVSGCLNHLMQPEKQNSATAAQSPSYFCFASARLASKP
ncbi:MAG: hypothetical protein D8B42_09635 [Kingella sp. (in: b-proteobacteria)]|jgi:hypothetical protein|nr:MAG: hypothetical protein D8B42_09635 [Kingella sp. (in: b-proteobacteria)]